MEDGLDTEVVDSEHQRIWEHHAHAWEHVTPPLRPSRADISEYEFESRSLIGEKKMPHVLLLGCTPEILLMQWPLDTHITCLEQSTKMVAAVYKKYEPYVADEVHARVEIGNWLHASIHFPVNHFDLVIGDGCYTQFTAAGYRGLSEELIRVMKPGATFLHRFFIKRPWALRFSPSPEQVLETLRRPFQYRSFSQFKLQLLVSMQLDFAEGVRLGDVYDKWHQYQLNVPFNHIMPQHYSIRERNTIEHYRGSDKRYSFPNAEKSALQAALAPFELIKFWEGDEPLARFVQLERPR